MSSVLRRVVIAVATGAMTAVAALGVAVTGPVGVDTADVADTLDPARPDRGVDGAAEVGMSDEPPGRAGGRPGGGNPGGGVEDPDGELGAPIPDGASLVEVGAAVRSIAPQPPEGARWETDRDACAVLSPATLERLGGGDLSLADHLASTGTPWPENPDCLYMGGYGIGPMFPITSVDEVHGLAVRGLGIRDADGDALVLVLVDGEGWFWDYNRKCDDCGVKQITQRMGDELGVDPGGIVIAATHSHTSPDFIGGWGFVPDWYMQQVTTTIEDVIRTVVTETRPAVLEVGEERAREHNRERRDTYRAAEEQQVGWLRALAVRDGRFVQDPDRDAPMVIGTLGGYAAHPTTRDHESGVAHPDWPALFADRVEQRFGGVAMNLMTGLGNLSTAGGTEMGTRLADELPPVATGTILTDTDVRTTRITYRQPATNVPLTALAVPGFFDHPIDPVPAELRTGENPDTAPCVSASPLSAEVPVAAAMIGDGFAVTTGPGELFANLTNTIKEKSPAAVTLPLAQANDALGYIPQSFEIDPVGQQGLGFAAGGYAFVNYEDSYAIDRCFGDMVLETSLALLADLATR